MYSANKNNFDEILQYIQDTHYHKVYGNCFIAVGAETLDSQLATL